MEQKRGRGRPRTVELMTIDQILAFIRNWLLAKYQNEDIAKRMSYSKGYIYNLVSSKRLTRYGKPRCLLLDRHEIEEKLLS